MSPEDLKFIGCTKPQKYTNIQLSATNFTGYSIIFSSTVRREAVHDLLPVLALYTPAAFLPAVNTTSQPVNLSRTVPQVVYTTGEFGVSRNFPVCDLYL